MKGAYAMKRREFMHRSCIGLAGIRAIGRNNAHVPAPAFISPREESKHRDMEFRTLGKTGLRVSIFGFGAMITPDAQLLYRALREYGVTYVDTARGYQGGTNERNIVSKGVGDMRKNVVITTKLGTRESKAKVIDSVETSLREIATDYIDIIFLHGGQGKDDIMNPEAL